MKCPACGGLGFKETDEFIPDPKHPYDFEWFYTSVDCSDCEGTGEVLEPPNEEES